MTAFNVSCPNNQIIFGNNSYDDIVLAIGNIHTCVPLTSSFSPFYVVKEDSSRLL